MQYVGIHTQQSRNNFRSLLLLCLFPCLVVGLLFVFCYLLVYLTQGDAPHYYQVGVTDRSVALFIEMASLCIGRRIHLVSDCLLCQYFHHQRCYGSRPLERKENKRVYNLVENLCMSQGMPMPKINIINDDSLNAYASGIKKKELYRNIV